MNRAQVRASLLARPEAEQSQPFGPDVDVFKVAGKMFALLSVGDEPASVTLKAPPAQALVWRQMYRAVRPGYHMNKQHWNTLTLDGSLPEDAVLQMIDASYALVVSKLPKAARLRLMAGEAPARP